MEDAEGSEVLWGLPDGLKVKSKPLVLDAALVGCLVYIRWASFGWCVGMIKEKFTIATPRLFAKFNYRVLYIGERAWKNHQLTLENYHSGPLAPYTSWCLLEKEAPIA